MLENILQKIASSEDSGMLKLSSDEAYVLEALGQAYLEGMTEGMIKMAEAMAESGVEEEVDPEEVVAAVEEAVEAGELTPEEGAEIISELDKTAAANKIKEIAGVKLSTPVSEDVFKEHFNKILKSFESGSSYPISYKLSPKERKQVEALIDAIREAKMRGLKLSYLYDKGGSFGINAGYGAARGRAAVNKMWQHVAKHKARYGLGAAALGGAYLLKDRIFGRSR